MPRCFWADASLVPFLLVCHPHEAAAGLVQRASLIPAVDGAAQMGRNAVQLTEQSSPKHEHSIFEMRFAEIDAPAFWGIFFGMLVVTVLVDRLESFASEHARRSRAEQMFLDRCNSELAMFGIVGLSIFVIGTVSEEVNLRYAHLVEFVDIVCSMGACNVIGFAAILFCSRRSLEQRWRQMSTARTEQRRGDFHGMARRFLKKRHLVPGFQYHRYLSEVLARNAVDLMVIDAKVWATLLVCVLLIWGASSWTATKDDRTYLIFYTTCHWSIFLGFFAVFLWSYKTYQVLVYSSHSDADGHGPSRWEIARMKWFLQLFTLLSSFAGSIYIMHTDNNIRAYNTCWYWRANFCTPLILCVFVLMPRTLEYLTVVDAFYETDKEALDKVLHHMVSLEMDSDSDCD